MDKFVQVETITLPAGTGAGLRAFPINLETGYTTCEGFYVIRNTGSAYLSMGLDYDQGKRIHAAVNINHFVASTSVKIDERFFKQSFQADGKKLSIKLNNPQAVSGTDESFDIIFLLSNPK